MLLRVDPAEAMQGGAVASGNRQGLGRWRREASPAPPGLAGRDRGPARVRRGRSASCEVVAAHRARDRPGGQDGGARADLPRARALSDQQVIGATAVAAAALGVAEGHQRGVEAPEDGRVLLRGAFGHGRVRPADTGAPGRRGPWLGNRIQLEVTDGGRIWYAVDDDRRTMWTTVVRIGHPPETG